VEKQEACTSVGSGKKNAVINFKKKRKGKRTRLPMARRGSQGGDVKANPEICKIQGEIAFKGGGRIETREGQGR